MKSFKDARGDTWEIEVNVASLRRIRGITDFDVLKIVETGKEGIAAITALSEDPVKLAEVLYAACKTQCDAKSISEDEFLSRLSGDPVADATDALLDEIVDFFPNAKRMTLRKILEVSRKRSASMKSELESVLKNPDFEKNLETELERMNSSSSNAPESAG
ncbi:MAG: hypothetical protein BWY31_04429 [Lentisphaerae bacterium ADurb.Bin242]|nr:MAG: hypothetical protein BWY31_04429 [Lentisphaerae bacterium ADurb.Bin242]